MTRDRTLHPLRWSVRNAATRSNALRLSLAPTRVFNSCWAVSDVEHNWREKAQRYHPSRLVLYFGSRIALSQNFKIWLHAVERFPSLGN